MISEEDRQWMQYAIDLAKSKGTDPSDTPIAAVIVRNGQIIGAKCNETAETNDATAHAEIVTIRAAGTQIGEMELRGATLYSTLQPCGMCTMATIWAKIGRIVYGAGRDDVHKMYFEDRHLSTHDFIRDAWRQDLVIEGGCLKNESSKLYYGPNDEVPLEEQGNI